MVMVTFQDLIKSLLSTDIGESMGVNRSVYCLYVDFKQAYD